MAADRLFIDSQTILGANVASGDYRFIFDVSDTTDDPSGTIKKITLAEDKIALGIPTLQSDILSAKTKTDFLTVTTSVNLNTINTKMGFISVTQNVDLDSIESLATSALQTISGIAAGGELSGTYPNPTLVNSAVIGKVLTGLSVTGSSISSTDTILQAFGKLQNQINGVLGGAVYQGTWNASTNSPSLTGGSGTKGYYYVVSVAGSTNLDGVTDWKVGDWAIYNGVAWQKVDNTDAVSSVNGQIGAVSLSTTEISEGTNLYYTTARFDTAFATKSTSNLSEGSNLYFTNARAINSTLTGYASGSGTITSSDNILGAIQKLNGNISGITSNATHTGEVTGATTLTVNSTAITNKTVVTAVGTDYVLISDTSDSGNLKKALVSDLTGAGGAVSSVNGQTGTVVLTTTDVAEGTNLYYTTARFNSGFSGKSTSDLSEGSNLYFTTARTLATALSGLSVTGSSISSTDTILQAFGKLQNQINGVLGGAIYQGTWNASTNSPSLTGGSGTKGYYYVVSVAGSTNLDGVTDWKVGDWAIYNGTAWQKVDNTDAVSSVDGQIGAVSLSGTYQALNSNLTTIAGLTATTDNFIVSVASAWASRTPAQVKTTLSLNNVENTALSTWAGSTTITTLGAVTTGTWNATAIDYSKGGSGLTSFTALSIAVTNTANTRTQIAPSAGQSVRINAGGTAWEAYTPGGGGSSTLDAITAATGSSTIDNANNVIEWQWNSMVTTAGMTFTSSSTALTNTAFTNQAHAVVNIKATGASAASNIVSKALYVSNTKTGTGSTNYGIYATTESGTGIANAAIVSVGYQGGGLQFGAASSTAGAFWSWNVTPTTSNYVLTADGVTTNINGSTAVNIRIGASARLFANNSGVCIGNANGVYGKLSLTDTVTASGLYGMVSLGANAFQGTAAGHFGRPAGTASTSSNTNGTWLAINAPSGSTADIFNFQTAGNSLLRLSSADSTLSLNVALKADVSASAIFQVDSTTKGVLFPRMTGTQAEAITGVNGLVIYSSDGSGSVITSAGFWGYSGGAWTKLN